MIEHMTSFDDVWFATREQIADHWIKEHPYVPKAKKAAVNGDAK